MLVGLLLASWLVLAQSATLATKGDEVEKLLPPPSDDILQQEINLDDLPLQTEVGLGDLEGDKVEKLPPPPSDDILQQEINLDDLPLQTLLQTEVDLGDLEGLDLPLLKHGEPQTRLAAPFSPRGRRPVECADGSSCTRGTPHYRLDEFPPARPTPDNIGNLCSEGRKRLSYGPWNLPQTGFSHLSRQGDALNSLEDGVGECCQLNEEEKLPCCSGVWSDVLEQFCQMEFSIKTRPFHCCKMEGSRRERCFDGEAPFPSYDFENQASTPSPSPTPSKRAKNPMIAFPPGQPSEGNFKNICKLRKYRVALYGALANLPLSNFGWFVRQCRALNRMENAFKKCCRKEDVGCARKGWETILMQFCKQEFSVKTKPHLCCKETQAEARFTCFASLAPYPAYDKEVKLVSLADITGPLLDSLCDQFTLLSKQGQIPALIQNITEPCCQLQGGERIQCAKDAKSQFITNLCSSQKKIWKDPKMCCGQAEDAARESCFNSNYLSRVPLASLEQPTVDPTEPALDLQAD